MCIQTHSAHVPEMPQIVGHTFQSDPTIACSRNVRGKIQCSRMSGLGGTSNFCLSAANDAPLSRGHSVLPQAQQSVPKKVAFVIAMGR